MAAVRTSPPTVSKLSEHVHTPQLINVVFNTSRTASEHALIVWNSANSTNARKLNAFSRILQAWVKLIYFLKTMLLITIFLKF